MYWQTTRNIKAIKLVAKYMSQGNILANQEKKSLNDQGVANNFSLGVQIQESRDVTFTMN